MSDLKPGEKEYLVPVEFIIIAKSKEEAYKKASKWYSARYDSNHPPNPEDTIETGISLASIKERCATCVGSGQGPNSGVPCSACGGVGLL